MSPIWGQVIWLAPRRCSNSSRECLARRPSVHATRSKEISLYCIDIFTPQFLNVIELESTCSKRIISTDTCFLGHCYFHALGPGIGPPGAAPGMPHIPPGPLFTELQLGRSVAVHSCTLYWPGQNPLPGQPGDWDESADQMDALYVLFQCIVSQS